MFIQPKQGKIFIALADGNINMIYYVLEISFSNSFRSMLTWAPIVLTAVDSTLLAVINTSFYVINYFVRKYSQNNVLDIYTASLCVKCEIIRISQLVLINLIWLVPVITLMPVR